MGISSRKSASAHEKRFDGRQIRQHTSDTDALEKEHVNHFDWINTLAEGTQNLNITPTPHSAACTEAKVTSPMFWQTATAHVGITQQQLSGLTRKITV